MGRRRLSFSHRADIAVGIQDGGTDRQSGADPGQIHAIIWQERQRNSTKSRGYRPVSVGCAADRNADARRRGTDM